MPIIEPHRLGSAEQAGSLLPVGLSIVGCYVLMKNKTTIDKQATDLCICSWAALQTYLQVCWSPASTVVKHNQLALS